MAVRRVKRLMLFSVVAACLLLFLQWRSVSDLESLNPNKQGKGKLTCLDRTQVLLCRCTYIEVHDREATFI